MKKTQLLYVLIPLLIAVAIRLYPTLISGMPFSTDGWPLIKNTEILVNNSPIPLSSSLLDSYNSFWPAISIFGAMLTEITGVSAITAMAIGIPIAAALAIPIFYTLVKKITQNRKIALISAILLATAFPYTLFTAGVTKETFASPIYITLILLFFLKHDWKTTTLFTVTSIALVLTHHLTAFFAVGILAALTIASYVSQDKERKVNSTQSNILYSAILMGATSLYLGVFSFNALASTVSASDILSVGAYEFAAAALTLYVISRTNKKSTKQLAWELVAILSVVIAILVVITRTSLLPTTPVVPVYYLLFAVPFVIALPLVSISLNNHSKKFTLMTPLFWLIPVVAFACYGIFANSAEGLSYAVRSINFLLPPLMILTGIGLYKLYTAANHPKSRTLTKIVACAIILSMATISINSVYATVSLQEPYLGYFWRYEPSEYQASSWLSTNIINQTVAGDNKVNYLVNQYFGDNVSVTAGLSYLQGNGSAPEILYIYNQMKANGYVLYQGIPVTLPANWTDKLSNYNCIYINNEVAIYARR
jgi:hypothetical protein